MNKALNIKRIARLVLYVVVSLVGIAAVVTGALDQGHVAELLGVIAGGLGAVGGFTASANIEKDKAELEDGDFSYGAAIPAIAELVAAGKALADQKDYEGKHRADEPQSTADYAASVRGD